MKLKYYLRGLGVGIIVTTIILTINHANKDNSISDDEIIARAAQLGMVMEEEEGGLFDTSAPDTESENTEFENTESENTESQSEPDTEAGTENGMVEDTSATEEITEDTQVPEDNTESTESAELFTLNVVKGQVCRDVCEELAEAGIVEDAEALRKYLLEENIADFISVGTYMVPMDATMEEIADILAAGSIEKQDERNQNR